MKIANISDIHSNLEALEAVLEDITRRGITEIYCLGDIIGYGADPAACLRKARTFSVVLRGNHEQGIVDPSCLDRFRTGPRQALAWTEAVLRADTAADHLGYLGGLPEIHEDQSGKAVFVHASPEQPPGLAHLFSRIEAKTVSDLIEMRGAFNSIPDCGVAFGGHTHKPGIFNRSGGTFSWTAASTLQGPYQLPADEKAMVNVGSVGQPRDGNPDACYVIFDSDARTVEFVRVQYDVQAAADKILGALTSIETQYREHYSRRLLSGT